MDYNNIYDYEPRHLVSRTNQDELEDEGLSVCNRLECECLLYSSQASPISVLRFAFSVIHESGRVAKTRQKHGRPRNTYHVNDDRWMRDGHGGRRGPHSNT